MTRFLKDPKACKSPGNPVLRDLIRGWGNEGWSALDDYLAGCIEHALVSPGPILECGSGLSTILIGVIAKSTGQSHWVLEHTPSWAARVQSELDRYELGSHLSAAPLKDYGDFAWYEPQLDSMPDSFSLVICDGPPGDTKGGRSGLVPVMNDRLKTGCVVLLDDAHREEERAIAKRWETELGATSITLGSERPYVELTVK